MSPMYFDELLKDEKEFPFPTSSNTHCFPVSFKNSLFEITTNSARIADSLTHLYRDIIMRKAERTYHTSVQYCYFEEEGRYIMTRNGKFAYSCDSLLQAVARFDWMLMSDIVDHHRHLPVIHASAVVLNGKAIIFAGKTGSGKSSLALLTGLKANAFISDDIVIVDKGICGVPRAICLAENWAKDFTAKGLWKIEGSKRGENYVYINPCELGLEINKGVVPAEHVIFLESNGKENKLTQLTPGMILKGLTENLFDTNSWFKEKLDILSDMTGSVQGAKLRWCDMSTALKEVQAFISR